MFTGLVEAVGTITKIIRRDDVTRLTVQAPFCAEVRRGDSISVSGVCTTAIQLDSSAFTVELTEETMRVTRFAGISAGAKVNLERALPANGRLDGHIVAGHVDGVGTVLSLEKDRHSAVLRIAVTPDVSRYIVYKGSICVDGISLTVASASEREFSVAVIPETLARTTLGSMSAGDAVNIETDMIARYVEKFLGLTPPQADNRKSGGITTEMLADLGW